MEAQGGRLKHLLFPEVLLVIPAVVVVVEIVLLEELGGLRALMQEMAEPHPPEPTQ